MTRYNQSIKPQTTKTNIYEMLFQLALKKLKSKDNLQNVSKKIYPAALVIQRCPNLFQTENTKVLAI